jgi:hypothetical protein
MHLADSNGHRYHPADKRRIQAAKEDGMMHRGLKFLLAGASVVFIAGVATAAKTSGPKAAMRAANITGASGTPATGPGLGGACATTGYDAFCPSGTCQCLTISSAKVTGSMAGTGTADLQVTEDTGAATTSVSGASCTPFFAVATLTTTLAKTALTETLNFGGMSCDQFTSKGKSAIQGGFGIGTASNSATGWGTVVGTSNQSSVTLHLKGLVTQ